MSLLACVYVSAVDLCVHKSLLYIFKNLLYMFKSLLYV